MPKGLKIALAVLLPLGLILAGFVGLAKVGIIPTSALAAKNPAFRIALKLVGIKSPSPKSKLKGHAADGPDPLAAEKKALQDQRAQLTQERSEFEAQKAAEIEAKQRARTAAPAQPAPDPREIARLATIYEQMPAEAVTKVFAKLPDPYVNLLLRKMDEKQVAEILALVSPDRAAKLTTAISAPSPSPSTGSGSAGGAYTPVAAAQ